MVGAERKPTGEAGGSRRWLLTSGVVLFGVLVLSVCIPFVYTSFVVSNSGQGGANAASSGGRTSDPAVPPDSGHVKGPSEWRSLPRGHETVAPVPHVDEEAGLRAGSWRVEVALDPPVSGQQLPVWSAYLVGRKDPDSPRIVIQRVDCPVGTVAATFVDVPVGTYDVQVRASGWISQDLFGVAYDGLAKQSTVALYRLGTLTCRVGNAKGIAVPGIPVALYPRRRLLPFFSTGDVKNPEADAVDFRLLRESKADGEASFVDLPPSEDYWLLAGDEKYASQRINGIRIRPGQHVTVDVVLVEGAYVVGSVVQYDGKPITGASIRGFRPYDAGVDADITVNRSALAGTVGWIQQGLARSGKDASFRLGPLSPGNVKVVVHVSGDATDMRVEIKLSLAPGETRDLGEIRPKYPPLELVFVCDGVERPTDLHVMVEPRPDKAFAHEPSASGLINVSVGSSERALIQNLPPGAAIVVVRSWSNATELVQLRVDDVGRSPKTVEVVLRPSASNIPSPDIGLSIAPLPPKNGFFGAALIHPTGSPVSLRYINGVIPAATQNGVFAPSMKVGTSGAGDYTIWATDGDRTGVTQFVIQAGEKERLVPVSLDQPAGGLILDVRAVDGSPINGATVEWYWNLEHLEKSAFSRPYLQVVSDAQGVALLKGFPANHSELCLLVAAPGFKSKVVSTAAGTTVASPRTETVWLERSSK